MVIRFRDGIEKQSKELTLEKQVKFHNQICTRDISMKAKLNNGFIVPHSPRWCFQSIDKLVQKLFALKDGYLKVKKEKRIK